MSAAIDVRAENDVSVGRIKLFIGADYGNYGCNVVYVNDSKGFVFAVIYYGRLAARIVRCFIQHYNLSCRNGNYAVANLS